MTLANRLSNRSRGFDTNYFKDQLAGILEIASGDPGCWHYHSQVTQDWARQMTVEGINEKGVWENPHERPNHAWDCAVLLLLAHEMRGVAFWRGEEPSTLVTKTHRQPEKPVKRRRYTRPRWLNR